MLGIKGVVDRRGGSGFLFPKSNLGGNNLGRAGARGRSIDNISPNSKFRMQSHDEYNRGGNTEGDEGMGMGLGGRRDYAGSAAPGESLAARSEATSWKRFNWLQLLLSLDIR